MKPVPRPSALTQKTYDDVVAALVARGAAVGSMFGMPCVKVDGKAFAGIFGDSFVAKLDGVGHARALSLRGSELFDPSGAGRPMKAWVVVASAHAATWLSLAADAFTAAMGPAAKKPAAKKPAAKKPAAKKPPAKKPAAKKPAAKKPAAKKPR